MSSLAHTATGPASIRMPLAATASMRLDTAWLKKAIAPLRHVYVYSTMFASIAGFIFGYDTGTHFFPMENSLFMYLNTKYRLYWSYHRHASV